VFVFKSTFTEKEFVISANIHLFIYMLSNESIFVSLRDLFNVNVKLRSVISIYK
jgi:hypothetical protein